MRSLNVLEQQIVEKLLAGVPELEKPLRQQLISARVEHTDDPGVILFHDVNSSLSVSAPRVPVEAATQPVGRPETINVLLHLREGRLFMLECYRNDSGCFSIEDINVDELEVFARAQKKGHY